MHNVKSLELVCWFFFLNHGVYLLVLYSFCSVTPLIPMLLPVIIIAWFEFELKKKFEHGQKLYLRDWLA